MYQIGDKLEDLERLDPDLDDCVILPKETDISKINVSKFTVEVNMFGGHVIQRKHESYCGFVKKKLVELLEFPNEIQEISSYGKIQSERATIHHVATDLNTKVTVKKSNGTWLVEIIKEGEIKKPKWAKNLVLGKTFTYIFDSSLTFSAFRAQVYRWAKANNKRIQVIPQMFNKVSITYLESVRSKSVQKRVHHFLDTIELGSSVALPDEFNSVSDSYLRVLISNHRNQFSYIRGTIHHLNPAPHIDSNGSFILNGKNWGKRGQRFIELKLRNTDYKFEDIK